MTFLLFIAFAFTAGFNPGFAQSNVGYAQAIANANAYAGYGGSASASSYEYSSYPNYQTGGNRDCTYDRCTPTCSRAGQICPDNPNPCNCPPGTIISEIGGKCVPEEQCQKYANCRGDYNASYFECPISCPSTCAYPDNQYCNRKCAPPGCQCNSGYILSSINGKCIKPEECPGGNVCRGNTVYMNCLTECPSLYCPVDETRVACGPSAPPCYSGCDCKYGYLRKSIYDHTCVLASECPPVNCNRPNEEWNTCVSVCYSESCKGPEKDCPFSPKECYPKCICKKGFLRNDRRVCIPADECPRASQ